MIRFSVDVQIPLSNDEERDYLVGLAVMLMTIARHGEQQGEETQPAQGTAQELQICNLVQELKGIGVCIAPKDHPGDHIFRQLPDFSTEVQ